jgi:predicted nucleic acid-binding protein
MSVPQRPLILDASCLLNLYASGRLREIAQASPQRLVVVDYVIQQEALYIRRRSAVQDQEERESVDIAPLISAGLLQVITINCEAEAATFVDLAGEMDDGEALTCALAIHRQYDAATDDRKAQRILFTRAPQVVIRSTLAIVRQWAELTGITKTELRAVLVNIRFGAHYYPGVRDPYYEWWNDAVS